MQVMICKSNMQQILCEQGSGPQRLDSLSKS
jgi:hypothetical protein